MSNITLYYRASRSDELFKTEARETKCFYILNNGRKVPKKSMKECFLGLSETLYFIETPEIVEQFQRSERTRKYRQRLEALSRVAKKTPDDVMLKILEMTEDWGKWL